MQRIIMATAIGLGILAGSARAHAENLEVTVQGLEPKGRLMLAVLGDAKAWKDAGSPLMAINAKVTASTMKFRLQVPDGTVAIRLFHDENSNGELDTNMLGIPREGFGFSNNPKLMGPASFEDAAFAVEGNTKTTIQVQ